MKKKLLSILPLLLFATTLVNAQDVTTYRGAFAPSPTRQWTEDWTNWNPQNTDYGTALPVVNVTTDITTNTTWTSGNVYLISGIRFVSSNAILTIEPGTIIKSAVASQSTLIIARGSKIIAEGTPCRPIVFTSGAAAGSRASGDWSGLIILGNAKHNLGTANQIEGVAVGDPRSLHGGTDDNDNSGTLKYVRIEYAGFAFSLNNEVNGLTLGSVGRGTTIDYVMVTLANDDAFEWFGGSANAKHLIAYKAIDDDWDTDNGFSGTVQYGLSIKDRNISDQSQSEGFESDNSATGVNIGVGGVSAPKTSAKFYNITQIGGFPCASNAAGTGIAPSTLFLHRRGARVRRNSDLKIFNSILMNNWRGLFVDDAIAGSNPTAPTTINFNEDSAVFRNNIIAGDFTTTWTGTTYNGTKSLAYENAASRAIGLNVAYQNDSLNTCSILTDAWNVNPALADLRPNTAGDGAVVTNPTNLSTGADLTPTVDIDNSLFTPNPPLAIGSFYDFVVNIFENGGGASNGAITITIPMPSAWDISVPSTTSGSSNVFGGTLNENSNWSFVVVPNVSVTITSKPGIIIPKGGQAIVGLRATRKTTTSTGTNQSLSVTLIGGGDNTASNNATVVGFGTSN